MNNVGGDFGNEDAHDTMNDSRANEIMGEDNMGSVRAQSAVHYEYSMFQSENSDAS